MQWHECSLQASYGYATVIMMTLLSMLNRMKDRGKRNWGWGTLSKISGNLPRQTQYSLALNMLPTNSGSGSTVPQTSKTPRLNSTELLPMTASTHKKTEVPRCRGTANHQHQNPSPVPSSVPFSDATRPPLQAKAIFKAVGLIHYKHTVYPFINLCVYKPVCFLYKPSGDDSIFC